MKKYLIPLVLLLVLSVVVIGCPPAPAPAPPPPPPPAPPAPPPPIVLKTQTTWPAGLYLHAGFLETAKKIEEMSGGRLKLDVKPAGAIVPPFEVLDSVHKGILDAGHGWSAYWVGKHPAANLFASTPAGPFGMDPVDYVVWLYYGGGLELYRELYRDIMKLDVIVFPMDIIVTEPFGWFKKPIKSLKDLEGLKMREVGLVAEVYKEAGITVVTLPGGEILPAMEKGVIDAAAFMCPTSDMMLGLMHVAKFYHAPGIHRNTGTLELLINKKVWDKLPADLKAIVETATRESLLRFWLWSIHLNIKDLEKLKKEHGVTLVRTPDEVITKILEAWDKIAAKYTAKDPFFAKVYRSQKEFAEKVVKYKRDFYLPYEFLARHYWPEK